MKFKYHLLFLDIFVCSPLHFIFHHIISSICLVLCFVSCVFWIHVSRHSLSLVKKPLFHWTLFCSYTSLKSFSLMNKEIFSLQQKLWLIVFTTSSALVKKAHYYWMFSEMFNACNKTFDLIITLFFTTKPLCVIWKIILRYFVLFIF